jgi:hypothetical protein
MSEICFADERKVTDSKSNYLKEINKLVNKTNPFSGSLFDVDVDICIFSTYFGWRYSTNTSADIKLSTLVFLY